MAEIGGVNSLFALGNEFLIVHCGGGDAAHLAPTARPGDDARPAVLTEWLEPDSPHQDADAVAYDIAALTEVRWSPQTTCGRAWSAMSSGEAGPWGRWQEVQLAPTCRRCLSLLDRHFPEPERDARVDLIADIACGLLDEHGFAEIGGIPGDQLAIVRKRIRGLVRERLGYSCQTIVHGLVLYVHSDEAWERRAAENLNRAADALNQFCSGTDEPEPIGPGPSRLELDTWSVP